MCTGKCSRLVGLCLLPTALGCMAANLLLMFPNAQSSWTPENITLQVWLLGGLLGGGLMVLCAGCSAVRAGGKGCCGRGCCGNRCRMLRSVGCSVGGGLGASYCLAVSASGLADGPWCGSADGEWGSPFKGLRESYLLNGSLWVRCASPPDVVPWHVALFSAQLALAALQLVLCAAQVLNGLLGAACGDCRQDRDCEDEGL